MPFVMDIEAPARYQSEATSAPSKAFNCGITVVAAIADYYVDLRHAIEPGRALIAGMGPYDLGARGIVHGAPARKCTSAQQQADILTKLGVPCDVVRIKSVAKLHEVVDSGRRPMGMGLDFRLVPDAIAGHSFDGMHAIKLRTGTIRGGIRGFLVNDPNFWPSRPDPTDGKRFYPDDVLQRVLGGMGAATCVVPRAAKVAATFTKETEMAILGRIMVKPPRDFDVKAETVLHKGPGKNFPVHFKLPVADRFLLVGFDVDPTTGKETGWVIATRRGRRGVFYVPPEH
jgi:hypothetical protein